MVFIQQTYFDVIKQRLYLRTEVTKSHAQFEIRMTIYLEVFFTAVRMSVSHNILSQSDFKTQT